MRFLYLALHYPRQEHARNLLEAMATLGAVMRGVPGMIEATAWLEKDRQRIVATSIWESEESFIRAIPVIQGAVKDVPFSDWERKPRYRWPWTVSVSFEPWNRGQRRWTCEPASRPPNEEETSTRPCV